MQYKPTLRDNIRKNVKTLITKACNNFVILLLIALAFKQDAFCDKISKISFNKLYIFEFSNWLHACTWNNEFTSKHMLNVNIIM